jgi:hypothetical protein
VRILGINCSPRKGKTTTAARPSGAKPSLPTRAAFDELRQKANAGDLAAQSELRRLMDAEPGYFEQIGNLAGHAESSLFRLVADGDFVVTECLRRRAEELRRQLTPPFPAPLEILAIKRVVSASLLLNHVETQIAKGEADLATSRLWLKRQEQAARLYHLAVKSLVLVQQHLAGSPAPADGGAVLDDTIPALPGSGHVNRIRGLTQRRNPAKRRTALCPAN